MESQKSKSLYHISETADIACFEPRPAPSPKPGLDGEMVWAVDSIHLRNYLLPRDCPRVTFYPIESSTARDIEHLMGYSTASAVVAIESGWMPEVLRCCLYRYEFPPEPFTVVDAGAGYYIAREPIVPISVTLIEDVLVALLAQNIELRVMPSLWKLYDAVITSSLQYSIIRWRNAKPRSEPLL